MGIIFSFSLVLAMAFFTVALLVSCWIRSTLGALFVSLGIWVLFVLIVPPLAVHFGAACKPVPSRVELRRQMEDAAKEIALRSREESKAKGLSQREIEVLFIKSFVAQQKARARVYRAFRQRVYAQMELVRRISLLSPYSCFVQIARTFSGTGTLRERRFDEAATNFKWIALQYMIDKDEEFYQESRSITKRVNIEDVPWLRYEGESLAEKLDYSVQPMSVLVCFCGFFFMVAYRAFMRYDVR